MKVMRFFMDCLAVAVAAAGISGCATDSGVYVGERGGGFHEYSSPPKEAPRVFELPEALDAVAPLTRESLVGRWRCFVDEGHLSSVNGSTSLYMDYYAWHLDEYEFRQDGTYSMWHVAKNNAQTLPHTEEGGKWKYENGGLSLSQEYQSRSTTFGGVERQVSRTRGKWTDYTVTWHSPREFTLRYRDPDAFAKSLWGGYASATGWYDKEGCFQSRVLYEKVPLLIINGPLRFKKQ